MKLLIVAWGICACIALTAGEPCTGGDISSCTHEVCGDHTIGCVNGVCTCIVDFCGEHDIRCRTIQNHCVHMANQHNCNCAFGWHCIDGHCACGYPTSNSTATRR